MVYDSLQQDAARALALRIGEKILENLTQPCTLAGHHCVIGVSIGIALLDANDRIASQIIKRADQAMYQVKASRSSPPMSLPR